MAKMDDEETPETDETPSEATTSASTTAKAKSAPKPAPKPMAKAPAAGPSPGRKYVAEFLGTFLLLFMGIGAAIFTVAPIGMFNEGFISLSVGLSIGLGIYAWGNISGGHYNPAVTFGFLLSGRLRWEDAIPYWVSQVLGGLTGLGCIYAIAYGYQGAGGGGHIVTGSAMGANGYFGGGGYQFSAASVLLFEILATFVFVTVILFVTDKDGWKGFHGLSIGLTLSMLVLLGINVDGLSVNPARSTASAVWDLVAGISWPIDQLWVFWVAPLVGAAIGALLWRLLRNPQVDAMS